MVIPITLNVDLHIADKDEAVETFIESMEALREHVESMSEQFFEDGTIVDSRFKVGYSILWDFAEEEEEPEE